MTRQEAQQHLTKSLELLLQVSVECDEEEEVDFNSHYNHLQNSIHFQGLVLDWFRDTDV